MNNYIVVTEFNNYDSGESIVKIIAENYNTALIKLYRYNTDNDTELFEKAISNLEFDDARRLYDKFSDYTIKYFLNVEGLALVDNIYVIE